jgi:hypothetical protein
MACGLRHRQHTASMEVVSTVVSRRSVLQLLKYSICHRNERMACRVVCGERRKMLSRKEPLGTRRAASHPPGSHTYAMP